MITVAKLIAAGANPTQAKIYAEPLSAACARFDISSLVRIAAFVAQCLHESTRLTRAEENLFYSTPERIRQMWPTRVASLADAAKLCGKPRDLACAVYSGRLGNGGPAFGDGWRYRGRGLIQLTGRGNYTEAALDLGRPYIDQPDLVGLPTDAAMTAAWFWDRRNLNSKADASDTRAITLAINGPGLIGLADRMSLFDRAMVAFA